MHILTRNLHLCLPGKNLKLFSTYHFFILVMCFFDHIGACRRASPPNFFPRSDFVILLINCIPTLRALVTFSLTSLHSSTTLSALSSSFVTTFLDCYICRQATFFLPWYFFLVWSLAWNVLLLENLSLLDVHNFTTIILLPLWTIIFFMLYFFLIWSFFYAVSFFSNIFLN